MAQIGSTDYGVKPLRRYDYMVFIVAHNTPHSTKLAEVTVEGQASLSFVTMSFAKDCGDLNLLEFVEELAEVISNTPPQDNPSEEYEVTIAADGF